MSTESSTPFAPPNPYPNPYAAPASAPGPSGVPVTPITPTPYPPYSGTPAPPGAYGAPPGAYPAPPGAYGAPNPYWSAPGAGYGPPPSPFGQPTVRPPSSSLAVGSLITGAGALLGILVSIGILDESGLVQSKIVVHPASLCCNDDSFQARPPASGTDAAR